ncbi:MAG: hypothetical protein A3I44_05330 [Candidatus Sungbacteria bacterium RIFCSPLOWO2_02_FULL_51_17]|uniref:UPF0102 protein A3C16_04460 n=1 Tax=Candidatus Sungbacteria bacterium RIFCSPHIGHO2_02_FULL_51_29 TaxID=1802273 RepID=A0A1G2KSU2_9BACT|nr:MAG: hypothetical protein A2676_01045 [Candidatus Sungbacteria bacterium RIFCSPHIGHO2_01_FULL_51_22]OHA01672.1 MAG: hypothetical protein A3C16_04460 [Candidatus Sungbacteria bacterium RIFCSPHIGHO2_02_FULL_51_29]OHA10540.1 MAG: hypothetical protein A3I44_05330 [Candidatus Sungbacteria bacterium RIFCSPLOWO2_02_FULL_51_17]
MAKTKKRELGDRGEEHAVHFLKEQGFSILARNHRIANIGELDIITKKGNEYIFFEVKTRDVAHEAEYPILFSIDARKRAALKRACELYLIEIGRQSAEWRVDAILISVSKKTGSITHIEHMENILWERYY